jgi:3'-5' exoribonuclease
MELRGNMKLDELVDKVKDPILQKYALRTIHRKLDKFFKEPAATANHHAYKGGLLDHSINTALLAIKLADHFESLGNPVKRDVLIVGSLLHDIGKVECYVANPAEKFGYSSSKASKLYHHIPIGFHIASSVAEEMQIEECDDVMDILHIIISHHGRVDWSSPRPPKTVEAFLAHKADMMDAYMAAPPEYKGSFGNGA